jgi:hypothetical protein
MIKMISLKKKRIKISLLNLINKNNSKQKNKWFQIKKEADIKFNNNNSSRRLNSRILWRVSLFNSTKGKKHHKKTLSRANFTINS